MPYHSKIYLLTNQRAIDPESIQALEGHGISIVLYENGGYDFGMWARALKEIRLDEYDELTLINDSCVLVGSLGRYFKWADHAEFDFSSMSDNYEVAFHLQSFFLLFRRTCFSDLSRYLSFFDVTREKLDVVLRYEIGITRYLVGMGFRGEAYFKSPRYSRYGVNLTIYRPLRIINAGFPLVKKSLLSSSSYSWWYRWVLSKKIDPTILMEIQKTKPSLHGLFFEALDMLLYKSFGIKTLSIIR